VCVWVCETPLVNKETFLKDEGLQGLLFNHEYYVWHVCEEWTYLKQSTKLSTEHELCTLIFAISLALFKIF